MEQLRVPKLLASALAAVSGAVVASLFGIEGTLIGAALVSLLVVPAEALYTHSLASAHRVARRSLVRRVGEHAGASQEGTSQEGTSRSAGSESRSRRWLPSGLRSARSPGWRRSPTSRLPAWSGAGRGKGGAPRWMWSSAELTGRRRRQPGCRRPPPRPHRRGGPHRRRRRLVFLPLRRRARSPAPRPQPHPAHRPRPPKCSDLALQAHLERPTESSQHARTSETQHLAATLLRPPVVDARR
jgi:hypothetical protein